MCAPDLRRTGTLNRSHLRATASCLERYGTDLRGVRVRGREVVTSCNPRTGPTTEVKNLEYRVVEFNHLSHSTPCAGNRVFIGRNCVADRHVADVDEEAGRVTGLRAADEVERVGRICDVAGLRQRRIVNVVVLDDRGGRRRSLSGRGGDARTVDAGDVVPRNGGARGSAGPE